MLVSPNALLARRRSIVWPSAAICLVLLTLGGLLWLHAAGPGAGAGYDFGSYLQGARDILAGRNPYHGLIQQVTDTRLGDTGIHSRGYVYPPLLAVTLALFLRIGVDGQWLWVLWNAVNALALVWMGWELNRTLRGRMEPVGALCFGVAALLPAVATYDLWLGQADMLMAALAVIACALWLRDSQWSAVILGVAIAVKPTMALILLVWLWLGDWRGALRGAAVGAALILGPFLLLGVGALGDYITFFRRWNAFHANAEFINQSPYGLLQRLFTRNPYTRPLLDAPQLAASLRFAVVALLLIWWVRVIPRGRAESVSARMGVCLLVLPLILLFGPLSEDIHFCLLIPTLLGYSWLAWSHGMWRRPAAWAIWLALILSCAPRGQEIIYPDHLVTLPWQTDPAVGWLVVLARSAALVALAALTLFAAGGVLRAARAEAPRESKKQPAPVAAMPVHAGRDGL